MRNWILKGIAAIIVWVIAALVVAFAGTLLKTVDADQIKTLGEFLVTNAGLIGFLCGAVYFVWGRLPQSWIRPQ